MFSTHAPEPAGNWYTVDKAGADEEVEVVLTVVYAGAVHAAGAAKIVVVNRAQVAFARRVRPRMLMMVGM